MKISKPLAFMAAVAVAGFLSLGGAHAANVATGSAPLPAVVLTAAARFCAAGPSVAGSVNAVIFFILVWPAANCARKVLFPQSRSATPAQVTDHGPSSGPPNISLAFGRERSAIRTSRHTPHRDDSSSWPAGRD